MLRTSEAIRLGVHPRTLYALRDSGGIEQVARGFYRLSEKPALTNPDLVAVALRIPRAVICLISALAHHGLTTQVPHTVDLALRGHAQIPQLGGIPLRVFWYSEPSFSAGVQSISQAQVTSGEDEGDLLDDGIGQLFSVLHANLLETGKQMIIVGCR